MTPPPPPPSRRIYVRNPIKAHVVEEEEPDIPNKCKNDPLEEQMHISYIMNNTFKIRDEEGAIEIRNRYPKKGNIRCVYKFTNQINGKSYIGQTGNLWARLRGHLRQHNLEYKQEDLQRAIRKHGIDNFEFEVLLDDVEDPTLKTEEGRLLMEALYIKKYNSYLNGYNTAPTHALPKERKRIYEELNTPRSLLTGGSSRKRGVARYMSLPYGIL